jgi:hypothetical protein
MCKLYCQGIHVELLLDVVHARFDKKDAVA